MPKKIINFKIKNSTQERVKMNTSTVVTVFNSKFYPCMTKDIIVFKMETFPPMT
jgi:hypothetical protein